MVATAIPDPVRAPITGTHRRAASRSSMIADVTGNRLAGTPVVCASTLELECAPCCLVALRKDGCAARALSRIIRQEVRPFTDKQIALFAELRGAGGHRDGERAAASTSRPRPESAGTADRDREVLAGHQFARPVDLAAGVRRDARKGSAAVRAPISAALLTCDGDVYRTAAVVAISPEHRGSRCARRHLVPSH